MNLILKQVYLKSNANGKIRLCIYIMIFFTGNTNFIKEIQYFKKY